MAKALIHLHDNTREYSVHCAGKGAKKNKTRLKWVTDIKHVTCKRCLPDPKRKAITEKSGVHKKWKKEAEKIRTRKQLDKFIAHLLNDYEHDYGTICHAMVAAMTATYKVMNWSPQGGITGFQASCIGWEMVTVFMGKSEGGRRMLKWQDLLYPQYQRHFKTITAETHAWLQNKAKELLEEWKDKEISPEIRGHWTAIAEGAVPFGLTVANEED